MVVEEAAKLLTQQKLSIETKGRCTAVVWVAVVVVVARMIRYNVQSLLLKEQGPVTRRRPQQGDHHNGGDDDARME